jgi:hypothetical protein
MSDAMGAGGTDRTELDLFRRALRQDWPIPPEVKRTLLQRAIDIADPNTDEGKLAPKRTVIAALKVIALYCGLSLKQQSIDLERERLDLDRGSGTATLADLVAEAEAAAENYQPALPPATEEPA